MSLFFTWQTPLIRELQTQRVGERAAEHQSGEEHQGSMVRSRHYMFKQHRSHPARVSNCRGARVFVAAYTDVPHTDFP